MVFLIESISKQVGMYVPAYPLPLMEIAAYATDQDPTTRIEVISLPAEYGLALDREGKERVYRLLLKELTAARPCGVGISCTAVAQAESALELCTRIKELLPDTFVFLGGYFPTLYFKQLLGCCPEVDLVVVGEGEVAAAGVISALEAGIDPRGLSLPNLAWRDRNGLHTTRLRQRFDLSRRGRLKPKLLRQPDAFGILPYSFSRGCPYRCSYCMEQYIRPQRHTVPAPLVERDLKYMAADGRVHTLLVADALFASFEHVPALRSLGLRMNFETRCDTFEPERLPVIADVCGIVALGLESASYATLRRMNKVRNRDHWRRYLAGAEALFRTASEAGIPLMVFMIAGYPGDTEADLAASLDFAHRLAATAGPAGHVFKVGECHVYPGTRIHDQARTLPAVVYDDDGIFGQNVVRQPSKGLNFDTVTAYMRKIYALSARREKLTRRLARLMPFFRLPAEALTDPLVPDACYRDRGRHLLDVRTPSLALFEKLAPQLQAAHCDSAAASRSRRRLAL